MWMLRSQSKSFPSVEVDFLNLCKNNVRSIEDLANGGNLLNQRQCQDLSSKLSRTTLNIRELVLHCGASAGLFRPALENLSRFLEKAKLLVQKCGEEDWSAAAVFQSQNENAFQEILLDVALCYNAIFEEAKSTSKEWNDHLEDLRQCSMFLPAAHSDILKDQQELRKRLGDLASGLTSVKLLDYFIPGRVAVKQYCPEQYLAKYLLLKLNYTSEQPEANALDTCSAILWSKETEPSGTWGNCRLLGSGSGAAGVCSTTWMGIPCAKKEFHSLDSERLFLKEAGILAHLKHPCIVNFFCCGNGQQIGDRFIAMELMEKSLFKLIEDQKDEYFPLPVVVDIIVQIARGMCYLHEQCVAHRDLKPQNVVVNRLCFPNLVDHFSVKLVDFGMAKTKVQVSKSSTISIRGVGTTMYRAPEVHPKAHPNGIGKAVWFKADVYSFAMTCAHVLSLKVPFGDMQQLSEKLYNELMNGRRPKLPVNCPQELVKLIKDCWDTNPSSRPSFTKICTRLESIQHKIFRGFSNTGGQGWQEERMDFGTGLTSIKMKLEDQSSVQRPLVDNIDDEGEGGKSNSHENNRNDVVSIIPCTCGRVLELLPQSPYSGICNMCREKVNGAVYHCESCNFDAHPNCAEIKDEVKVFFHDHPLHLLVQNYYHNNLDTMCHFCEESVHDSEWVYRCGQCDFDVHALCTKYSRKMQGGHFHPLTLIHYLPSKSMLCTCCNSNLKGYRYTCTQRSCKFDQHSFCAILPFEPLCTFDSSHRLSLVRTQRGFYCSKCGALGFSWFYRCDHCDVDIHLDCVDAIEEEGDWNSTSEKFMLEYGTKDDHIKVDRLLEVLDRLLVSDTSGASSSSSSRPQKVMVKGPYPKIQRLTSMERPRVDALISDVNLCKKIAAADTVKRKAQKMTTNEARLKWKGKSLEMLEKFETIILDLQTSSKCSMSQADAQILAATSERLKKKLSIVQEEKATQVQISKMHQGPRLGLFFLRNKVRKVREVLTSLEANMDGVHLALFCEEPGHEHIVDGAQYWSFYGVLGERYENLQPLLAAGLQVVTRAMSLAPHLSTRFDSVSLPNLAAASWDLRAIEVEKHGKQSSHENVEVLKRAEDAAAEWLLSCLEESECLISDSLGLWRVRYTVTDEGNFPWYTQGTLAWLCSDHLNRGLEAGLLESYPLRMYHNLNHDQQRRFL